MSYYYNEIKSLLLGEGGIVNEIKGILPYFLVGVILEALIRTYKLHVKIRKSLTKYGYAAIFLSTLVGTISPLCACGILPLTISLLIGGLPLAPAMALLVSSPLMSPAGYILTKYELGLEWANIKLIASFFMGIYAGIITALISKYYKFQPENLFKNKIPEGDMHDHDYPVESLRCFCNEQLSNRIAKKNANKFIIFLAKAYEGFMKIGKFALIGVLVEVIGTRYIPTSWIENIFGMNNYWISIPAITIFSVPLHINQISSVAILAGVIDKIGKNLAPGAGLAFLIGAPVTALPVMAVFLSLFKKKVFFLYLSICLTGSILIAYLYQLYTLI